MVRGALPPFGPSDPDSGLVEVAFPVRTPETTTGGGDTYGALAPVAAVNLGDFGLFPKKESREIDALGDLLDAVDRTVLNSVDVSAIRLDVDSDVGFKEIASATPPTAAADALTWTSPRIREQTTRYVLHDAASEASLIRNTFIGGVIGGLAAGLLIWALELALVRRRS